ncbi:unnamed protein product [Prunus armeniaca]|uniref:NusG-like N-terminal domain-containing protein n=1 Tax=Prunus armeniaca TaxID=36596 RepID=A0A6J5TXW0_PRUAR|nr:unnamed protein product [Prunus armeniaca]
MACHRDEDDYEPDQALDGDEEEEHEEEQGGQRSKQKRRRSDFIDDDEAYDGGVSRKRRNKRPIGSKFLDIEAEVDNDKEEEEEDEGEDDFIVDTGTDLPKKNMVVEGCIVIVHCSRKKMSKKKMLKRLREEFKREYDEEETTDLVVNQQALLPCVRDPKLWMVKCAIGREREAVVCLMQKYIDKPKLNIKSVVALDHLKNFIYIEADNEAHVREACKGLRNILALHKLNRVPIGEMTDVLSVESKAIDVSRGTWVRMKMGTYKGDLAKVVGVDDVRQRVRVKLIPRIDLQAIANKLEADKL